MQEKIKIKVQDFYKDAVGGENDVEVSKEIYELLTKTFPREEHCEYMRDIRHLSINGYRDGDTEYLINSKEECLEDIVLKQMQNEKIRQAIQTLTVQQRERVYLYFYEGMTIRSIAERQNVNRNAIWKSLQNALAKIRADLEKSNT